MATRQGDIEGRLAGEVQRTGVCAGSEQGVQGERIARRGGQMQRPLAIVVRCVGVEPAGEQELDEPLVRAAQHGRRVIAWAGDDTAQPEVICALEGCRQLRSGGIVLRFRGLVVVQRAYRVGLA